MLYFFFSAGMQEVFPMQGLLDFIEGVDGLDSWCSMADGLHLFVEVHVTHKHQFNRCIIQDELQFIHIDGWIDGCEDCTRLLNGHV